MDKEELFNILLGKEKMSIYSRFQEIEEETKNSSEYYQYFKDIVSLLYSDKENVRMKAFRLLCELAKYDILNQIEDAFETMFQIFDGAKPTILRMCMSIVPELLSSKPHLYDSVVEKLNNIDLTQYKDSMVPLLKKDITSIINK